MKKIIPILLLVILVIMTYITFKQNTSIPINCDYTQQIQSSVKFDDISKTTSNFEQSSDIDTQENPFVNQQVDISINNQQSEATLNSFSSDYPKEKTYNNDNTKSTPSFETVPFTYYLRSSSAKTDESHGFTTLSTPITTLTSDVNTNDVKELCHPIKPPKPPCVPVGDFYGVLAVFLAIYISFILKRS